MDIILPTQKTTFLIFQEVSPRKLFFFFLSPVYCSLLDCTIIRRMKCINRKYVVVLYPKLYTSVIRVISRHFRGWFSPKHFWFISFHKVPNHVSAHRRIGRIAVCNVLNSAVLESRRVNVLKIQEQEMYYNGDATKRRLGRWNISVYISWSFTV